MKRQEEDDFLSMCVHIRYKQSTYQHRRFIIKPRAHNKPIWPFYFRIQQIQQTLIHSTIRIPEFLLGELILTSSPSSLLTV